MAISTTNIGSIQPVTEARIPAALDTAGVTTSLETYISDIIGLVTIGAALVFIVYIFIAAFEFLTAGGDSGKTAKATSKFTNSIVGLVLVVASYMIIGLIGNLIGIPILNPGEMIGEIIP